MLAAFVERVRNRYSGAFVGADDRQSSLQVRKTADPELYFAGKVDGVLMVLNSATSYFQEQEDEATRKIYSNRLRPFVQQVAAANNGHVSSRLLNDYLMLTLHPDEDPETRDMRDLINYSRIFSDMLTDGTLIIGNRNTESEYFKLVADPVGHYEI